VSGNLNGGYPEYQKKDEELRAAGKWELVHKTPDSRNFDNMEFGENNEVGLCKLSSFS
jgi:hypothetical protein